MNNYRVSFYKDLLNSDGHRFKCLQKEIDVRSDDPSHALVLAEQLIDNAVLDADCVEVAHLPSHHYEQELSSSHSTAPCEQTWTRAS